MDYVIGSVAALVTGNVTPSRPRLSKRALTPTKHQPSPNVTPKSEFVEDRSKFLSPSMQKKKAIVKKSPKRIFQNPDLETTDNGESNLSTTSPKADKVKKHLKVELDDSIGGNKSITESKSPKNKGKNKKESIFPEESCTSNVEPNSNENTPKKKKRKSNIISDDAETQPTEVVVTENCENAAKSPKKMKERRKSMVDDESNKENDDNVVKITDKSPKTQINNSESTEMNNSENKIKENPKKKNKNRKKKQKQQLAVVTPDSTENAIESVENNQGTPKKKKNRKRKKSQSEQNIPATETDQPEELEHDEPEVHSKKSKPTVNPNAITEKESDSEHESDNEIESENEETNRKVFESEQATDESSDEEGEEEEGTKTENPKKEKAKKKKEVKEKAEINTEDDIKRTLFVGNVPFSAKCKKEIKKIFNKHGQIKTIRIRTVPVKDGRYTPKLAVIKNELHPERTTVNVYIKYAKEDSVTKALAENNTVLNEHHLRVSRSSHTGAEHDPKCSIFVGNLPFAMEDEALRQKFENCGEIDSVRIIRDKKTNAGKGFGYVNFTSKDGVELALALTEEDLTVKNRIIRVKRCTLLTNKQKQSSDNKGGFKKQFNQRLNQGGQKNNQFGQRNNQGAQRNNQFGQRNNQGGQRNNQFGQRDNQGGQKGNQGAQRWNQGGPKGNQGGQKGYQGGQKYGARDEEARDGAHRRLMHKRKNQDASGGDGPPNKKQKNINQPNKEKKIRKEFVGMTAEKKKKRKFDKGQKKKKALSEILTK